MTRTDPDALFHDGGQAGQTWQPGLPTTHGTYWIHGYLNRHANVPSTGLLKLRGHDTLLYVIDGVYYSPREVERLRDILHLEVRLPPLPGSAPAAQQPPEILELLCNVARHGQVYLRGETAFYASWQEGTLPGGLVRTASNAGLLKARGQTAYVLTPKGQALTNPITS